MTPRRPAPADLPPASQGPLLATSSLLDAWLDLAREWAGPGSLALIVSGSHARGDAVWTEVAGRPASLSDLDLYAVLRDRVARRDAERRAAAGRPGLVARLADLGLAGSLEVAFLTPADLAALPARPGTLDLRRHGRVVEGDPAWLERVPDWTPRDIGAEEMLLLLENRAFELLDAREGLTRRENLARLKARHATLKTVLDLAGVVCLEAGEYPDQTRARVARGRARAWPAGAEPPWDAALAWRAGQVVPLEPAEAQREWLTTARAWVALWRDRVAALPGASPAPGDDPFAAARRAARRASLRRRARQAVHFRARSGAGPALVERLRYWARGTPQHRLGASAAVMLLHAAKAGAAAPLAKPEAAEGRAPEAPWRTSLAWLGVLPHPGEAAAVERELVRRWGRWVLDGQRAEEAS